jgi:transcriptional regulator NrdR family protein
VKVRRRNGRREDFVREKIVVAVFKAGGSVRRARLVAKQVERALSGNSVVATERIRSEVLDRLRRRDPKAYRGWMSYRKR